MQFTSADDVNLRIIQNLKCEAICASGDTTHPVRQLMTSSFLPQQSDYLFKSSSLTVTTHTLSAFPADRLSSVLVNSAANKSGMLRSRDHFFGLGLTVTGPGLGLVLMKYWSRPHTLRSRGLKSILCSSSAMTSDYIPCSVNTRIWSL